MIKADEHDIDRAGRRIFRRVFEELNWIPDSVEDDYGIDYNVQTFSGKKATGAWFQVQLKSSRALSYSADGTFISHSLDLVHLRHFAFDLKQPLFLVLADVSSENLFWFCPQLNSETIEAANQRGVLSLTLRVPTVNRLPESATHLIEALRHAYLLIAARELGSSSPALFQSAIHRKLLDEPLLSGLQAKQDQVRLTRIAEAYSSGRLGEAHQRIELILQDPDTAIDAKFHALLQLNSVEFHNALFAGVQAIDLSDVHFKYAERLRRLAGRDHYWVRLAAAIVYAAARIDKAVQIDAADSMALKIHAASAVSPLATLGLLARRAANAADIVRLYNKSLRLVKFATASRAAYQLSNAVTRIPTAISAYLVILRQASDDQTANQFLKSCLSILDALIETFTVVGDERGIGLVILAAASLTHSTDSEIFIWITNARKRISDPELGNEIDADIQRAIQRWNGETVDGDYNPDPLWQIIEKTARSRGIDISDETSTLVRRLRIAAADDSPTKWMKFCVNLLLTPGAISPVDRFIRYQLGIQTSSNKVAHCTLYDFHHEDVSAEKAFASLKSHSCDQCQSRTPRPPEWTFSTEERASIAATYRSFVEAASHKGYGARYTPTDDLDK